MDNGSWVMLFRHDLFAWALMRENWLACSDSGSISDEGDFYLIGDFWGLGDEKVPKIFQNVLLDLHFCLGNWAFWRRNSGLNGNNLQK